MQISLERCCVVVAEIECGVRFRAWCSACMLMRVFLAAGVSSDGCCCAGCGLLLRALYGRSGQLQAELMPVSWGHRRVCLYTTMCNVV